MRYHSALGGTGTAMQPLIAFITYFMPLPIRTDRTLRTVPYVTYAICFLCIFVHLATLQMSGSELLAFHRAWGFSIAHPTWYGVLSYGLVHGDAMHLLGNLLLLWIVGTVLETGIGAGFFILVYGTSQVTALLLHGVILKVFAPGSESVMIGASGAIAGVLGLAAFRHYNIRIFSVMLFTGFELPIPFYWAWFPFWAYPLYFGIRELYEAFSTTSDGVAHWAHIGGMALGVAVGLLFNESREGKRESVLETAAAGEAPKAQSLSELQRLHRERPTDPDILEAMAHLEQSNGQAQRSAELYRQAIPHFLAAGLTDRAAISYLNMLQQFPDAVLDAVAQMKIASALEGMGRYEDAVYAFGQVVSHYPTRSEAENSLMRTALIYARHLHNPAMAKQALHTLLTDYPGSPLATMARERLKALG
jgi:membrane associated rhomboid family serine protease